MSLAHVDDDEGDVYVPAWERDGEAYYESCGPGPAFYPEMRRGRPIYLSGVNCDGLLDMEDRGFDIGLLVQPGNGTAARIPDYRLWAADNGCFAEASGGKWSIDKWWNWLTGITTDERLRFGCWGFDFECRGLDQGEPEPEPMGCLFATAPDVVCDAEATWRRSEPWFARIRELGLPVALVAQNGLEDHYLTWDEHERWDCLFVGGGCPHCMAAGKKCGRPDHADWKLSADARDAVKEAQALGKWVHLGRVNSEVRLRLAASWACDSADGTYLRFGKEKNVPQLANWLRRLITAPVEPCPTFWDEFYGNHPDLVDHRSDRTVPTHRRKIA